MRSSLGRVLVCLCVLLTACALFGQFESGSVLGTIHDPSGAVVASGTVTLENVGTGATLTTATNAQGDYTFVNVRLGKYRIRVEAAGFQKATTEDFEVRTDSRQRVDVTMKVGQVTESVMVTGAAAGLETDRNSRGQV